MARHRLEAADLGARLQSLRETAPAWSATKESSRLEAEWKFPDFAAALAFVNRLGALAEDLEHHPDIHLAWGRVRAEVWTHSAGGLTDLDFEFARRASALSSDG